MRLVRLEASGFRGFATPQLFDLDANAVVVVANNGVGKTTMLDAILWGLAGSIPRLTATPNKLMSLFSNSGQMHVGVTLRSSAGEAIVVERTFDGVVEKLTLQIGERTVRDERAASELHDRLHAGGQSKPESLAGWLTRTVYLEQDRITQFVAADTDTERFEAAAAVLGLGPVADFQNALDRARTAWNTATNAQDRALAPTREQVLGLEAQLANLPADPGALNERLAALDTWREQTLRELPSLVTDGVSSGTDEQFLERALRLLKQRERDAAGRAQRIASVQERLNDLAATPDPARAVSAKRAELNSEIDAVESALSALRVAEELASREHQRALALARAQDDLQALAEIALRHLGDHCPVCGQDIDESHVARRLRDAIDGPQIVIESPSEVDEVLRVRTQEVAVRQARLDTVQNELARLVAQEQERGAIEADLRAQFAILDLPPESLEPDALDQVRAQASDERARLEALIRTGEDLYLKFVQSMQAQARRDIERQLTELRQALTDAEAAVAFRRATGEIAVRALAAVHSSTDDLIRARLEELQPLAQRTYSAIDPHPAFRVVQLFSEVSNRRGRLHAGVEDPVTARRSDEPAVVLSTSQTSALAASLFLALNLGAAQLPLDACLLDDPLQNLDQVHLLGLVDVLRRVREQRQVIVTTHDRTFASLLARKLRPVSISSRTTLIEMSDQHATGAHTQSDVPVDEHPLKFVV
jgi:DNA repair exonuclease SbcCD ATPase subunit